MLHVPPSTTARSSGEINAHRTNESREENSPRRTTVRNQLFKPLRRQTKTTHLKIFSFVITFFKYGFSISTASPLVRQKMRQKPLEIGADPILNPNKRMFLISADIQRKSADYTESSNLGHIFFKSCWDSKNVGLHVRNLPKNTSK